MDKALEQKINRALASPSINIQGDNIAGLVQIVSKYVEQIKEDEEIVGQIRSYESRVKSARDNPDQAEELREAQALLQKAEEVERNLRRKQQVIKELQKSVENLYRELRKL